MTYCPGEKNVKAHRPWSHIRVDFLSVLPVSDNHTCLFVIIDRFSKSCKLIPFKGLPTALEATEALSQHVFSHFGPRKLSQTEVLSSSPKSGTPFSSSLESPSAYHPDITRKATARLRGRFRRSGGTCSHTVTGTRTAGVSSSPEQSTPRIPFGSPPQALLHSSVCLITSHPYSPGPATHRRFHLAMTGSTRVRGYGTQLTYIYSRQCEDIKPKLMLAYPRNLPTYLARKYGSPQRHPSLSVLPEAESPQYRSLHGAEAAE